MRPDIFRHIKVASDLIREVADHVDSLETTPTVVTKVAADEVTLLGIDMEELRGLANGR